MGQAGGCVKLLDSVSQRDAVVSKDIETRFRAQTRAKKFELSFCIIAQKTLMSCGPETINFSVVGACVGCLVQRGPRLGQLTLNGRYYG